MLPRQLKHGRVYRLPCYPNHSNIWIGAHSFLINLFFLFSKKSSITGIDSASSSTFPGLSLNGWELEFPLADMSMTLQINVATVVTFM